MEKVEKFSSCVKELTIVWIRWLKNNRIANDNTVSYSARRKSAKMCELLIKRRHELIGLINSYFGEE